MSWLWVAPIAVIVAGSVFLLFAARRLAGAEAELQREIAVLGRLRSDVHAVRLDAERVSASADALRARKRPRLRR